MPAGDRQLTHLEAAAGARPDYSPTGHLVLRNRKARAVTTYERVVDGEVVERVTPIDGSHEDTRIGVLVLEGGSEWRVEAAEPPAVVQDDTVSVPAADETAVTLEGADSATTASDAGTNVSEETDGAATTDGDGTGGDGDKPKRRR